MKPEDFEQQFAKNDPAESLSPMSENDIASTVAHATSADAPRLRGPVANRSKWFVGVAAATAAVVALNAPGAMVASVPVLHLAGGGNTSKLGAMDSMVAGGAELSKRAWWSSYHLTADGQFSLIAPSEGQTAYKLIPLNDIDSIATRIIDYFNLKNVVKSSDSSNLNATVWTNGGAESQYLYINSGPGASWSYFNSKYDNYVCSDITSGTDKDASCGPRTVKNVLSASEAQAKAEDIINQWKLSTGIWSWETIIDDRGATVTGTLVANGYKSPITASFTFADNGEISGAWGSLETLVELGDYNIISEFAAIERANEMTATFLKMANLGSSITPEDVVKEAEAAGTADSSSAASEPSPASSSGAGTGSNYSDDSVVVDPSLAVTGPNITAQEALVTDIKLTMISVWDTDGNHLWLPAYELVGHLQGFSEEWPLTTVVAVVDSQIDLSQFFGAGGVMPMMR